MQEEKALVNRAQSGDMHAFQLLVERNSARLYATAFRILNHPELAQDCLQDVFLKVHQKLPSFNVQSKFSTWAHSITVNTAIDHHRKSHRYDVQEDYAFDLMPDEKSNSPEQQIWLGSVAEASQQALRHLSEDVRIAFVLRHYEERSIDEISQILQVNPNTIKHRIFRAVKRMRSLLHSQVADYDEL